jgi:hypothetical protein
MVEFLISVGMFGAGIITGLAFNGINITINHKQKETEAPKEYNPSSANNLPKEMVEYAEKNHGMINL